MLDLDDLFWQCPGDYTVKRPQVHPALVPNANCQEPNSWLETADDELIDAYEAAALQAHGIVRADWTEVERTPNQGLPTPGDRVRGARDPAFGVRRLTWRGSAQGLGGQSEAVTEPGKAMRTSQVASINGIQLYVECQGEGEALLLLHGGGGVGANWRLIFDVAPDGYGLVIPDLRGHGRSAHAGGPFTFRQLALDVIALMDSLRITTFKAIGVSMGAKALLHLATIQPERVEAMVVVSATPYFPETTRALMRTASAIPHDDQDWARMRQWHPHGDDQIRALWAMPRQFADDYEDMSFTPPRLGHIQARTLIVHGDRDPLYPVALALEMRAAIPRSHLWVVPNGGHSPIFGTMAPLFAETALQFLNGQWKGPS